MIYQKQKTTYNDFISMKQQETLKVLYKQLIKDIMDDKTLTAEAKMFTILIQMREISDINDKIKKEKNIDSPVDLEEAITRFESLLKEF